MNLKTNTSIILFTAILFFAACSAKPKTSNSSSDNGQQTSNGLTEWQNQKFSMFIHFGLYSVPGGVWKGKQIGEYNEQIMAHAKIPKAEYRELANLFNPVNWNPDSVVALAKSAGMKSIVITSKHHDGFAMYHTKHSDFNVVDATPYKRDILKELSDACKKQGLRFGVYFSLIDWNFPGAMPMSKHNSDSIPPSHHQLNLNQVKELMTNYGPISEVWFDMGKPTLEQSRELAQLVKKFQPDCLVSGRIWNDQGDFAVMGDNASPDFRVGTPWQTPASIFHETWGYRSWQVRKDPYQKAVEKLTTLVKIVSNGGNYLLNIGPMGNGGIVPFEREVLTTIGTWFKSNGKAIYNTRPSPLPEQAWGVMTTKPQHLYLFLLDPPKDGILELKGLRSKPSGAYLLSDEKQRVGINYVNGSYTLNTSGLDSDDLVKVIALEYEGELQYTPSNILTNSADGSFELTAKNSTKYHSYSGKDYSDTKPTVIKMEWFIEQADKGDYKLQFESAASDKGKQVNLTINGVHHELTLNGESSQPYQKDVVLDTKKFNSIQVSLADKSNPHKDMELEGLRIRLKK
jgi:alpha-L-fucosidase